MAKKRANGEGNIRKRKDGRWEGRYTAGRDENGKAVYKNVLGKTQAEVKEKLKDAIEKTQGLNVAAAGKYTVGTWVETWLENYAKVNLRPSTYKTDKGIYANHIKPNIGKIPLTKLTTLDLQKFYKDRLENGRVQRRESKSKGKGLAPKTVQLIHQMISSALDLAVAQKLIAENPAKECKLPKIVRKEMQTLSEAQLKRG